MEKPGHHENVFRLVKQPRAARPPGHPRAQSSGSRASGLAPVATAGHDGGSNPMSPRRLLAATAAHSGTECLEPSKEAANRSATCG